MPETSTRPAPSRRGLILVGIATFAFWVSLYLYSPVLPLRARELGASATMIGAVVAAYAIGQVTLRIPIGIGSDIVGRKPFAIAAIALCAAGAVWLGLAPDPWSLFAARTLTGIGAAGWVAISVLYSSHFDPERPGRAMSYVMTINTTAIMLATLVGGVVAEHLGTRSVFFGAAGVGFAGVIFLLPAREPTAHRSGQPYSIKVFFRLLRSPLLLQVSAIAIALQFVTFGVNFGFLPVYAEDLGASKGVVGYIQTAGLVAAIAGTALSPLLARRFGSSTAVLVASAATLASLVAMPFTHGLTLLGTEQALNGFGRGLLNTVLISLALQSAPPHERATAMGTYQALYAIGMLTGPAVSGAVADGAGIQWVFGVSAIVTVLGAGLVFVRKLRQV